MTIRQLEDLKGKFCEYLEENKETLFKAPCWKITIDGISDVVAIELTPKYRKGNIKLED